MIRSTVCSFVLGSLLAIAVVGCEDPAKSAPAAATTGAKSAGPAATPPTTAAATVAAAPAAMKKYAFSGEGSKVEFTGSKVTGKHDGGFKTFTGTIEAPEGAPEKGTVTVEIDMASLYSDSEKLTGHLKADDFFAVDKFPKAKFTSTAVAKSTDGKGTHLVTGNLELHGVTKSISFPATLTPGAGTFTVTAEFSINRKDFGIEYAGMKDDLIRDDVVIKLNLAAKGG